jgi:hypothetical protein
MKADSRNQFITAWKSELVELKRLRWSLPDAGQKRLSDLIDKLDGLVILAADYSFPVRVSCGVTGYAIPPEDAGRCNNAEGCDTCPHADQDQALVMDGDQFLFEFVREA